MKCRLCLVDEVSVRFDFGDQPIVHHLLRSRDDKFGRYPFQIGSCRHCGFLQLVHPISASSLYENYFTVSGWKRHPHVGLLLDTIKAAFNLSYGSRVLEVGCNDGSFLELLREDGFRELRGVEPALDAYNLALTKGFSVENRFFSTSTAAHLGLGSADLIIARHVIEHIVDLHDFLEAANSVLAPDGGIVLEFPDQTLAYQELDYAFWEEHVNYFTLGSISNLLVMHGFEIFHSQTALFTGRAMTILARKAAMRPGSRGIVNADSPKVDRYVSVFPVFSEALRAFLRSTDSRPVVYGAGARACSFVNLLDIGSLIESFVDDQPEKRGMFVPGCGLQIRTIDQVDRAKLFLLAVNTENEAKVITNSKLTRYFSILPPSRLLPRFWREIS